MRRISQAALLAFLCAVALDHDWTSLRAQPQEMSRTTIQEAIAFGAAHEPKPYLLRHAGDTSNPVVVAAVYTPFLRIAFLSHAAAERGREVDPASVDASLMDPLVHMAFRWYCCDSDHVASLKASKPRASMFRTAAGTSPPRGVLLAAIRGVPPVWSKPGSESLTQFGAMPPYDDIALVAAFPLERLKEGQRFAVYKEIEGSGSVRIGVVRADDASRWR